MTTDSLTLYVCLDADGKAKGQLYEDEGDGFSYREGNYSLSTIEASLNKKQLSIVLNKVEGQMEKPQRTLRIAYVKGGKVQYSAWQTGNQASMKIKK